MAKIFKRGKALWLTYSVRGKRYRESLGLQDTRENRKLARKIKLQKEAEILNGVHPLQKRVRKKTLKSAYQEFKQTKENRSEKTIRMYDYAFNKLIDFTGDKEVIEIDENIVKEFEKFIQYSKAIKKKGSKKKEPKKNSKNTIEIVFRHLRIIFEFFRKLHYIETNPFPVKERTGKRIKVLSKEELDLILFLLKKQSKEHYRVIKFLVMTGLRAGELIRLTFEDIDFKRNLIYVSNSKGRREDTFPLYKDLREFIIENWKESERKGRLVNYERPESLWKFFSRFLEREKLNHYSIHELRKTFLTRLANSGMSLFDLQKISRHKDIKTTEKYYLAAEYERIGEKINDVISDTINDTTPENNLKIAQNRE